MSKPHRFFYFWGNLVQMKNFILFCFITAISTIAQAQIALQVSEEETKEHIEFASILLPEHKKSFVADEHGKFLIDTNKYKLPLKVIVKQFGFEPKEITLQNATNLYNIYLNPISELLREVIIPPKNAKIKERTFGRTNENIGKMKGESNYTTHNQSQIESNEEFGMIINTNNNFKKIKKVHWHINEINFQNAFFGLQFYEVQNGKPSKKIPHPLINFVLTNRNTGWNTIDIDELDVYINKNKKIAAIIKVQKIEFKKGNNNGSYVLNIGLTLGNSTVGRYSQYEEWSKVPASFPFYITVDSYE